MVETMRAARLVEYGHDLEIEDVPVPVPVGEEVLVEVAGAGICHSDLHLFAGEFADMVPVPLPFTPGHEVSGTVTQLGPQARGFEPGDPVLVYGAWGCGACRHCAAGSPNLCDLPLWAGLAGVDGGYAERILVPSYRYLLRAEGVDLIDAVPVTDAVLTAYRAVGRVREDLSPSSTVVVVGVGALGNAALQLLAAMVPSPVVAVDPNPRKRALALALGAVGAVDPTGEAPAGEIASFVGEGVGATLDFVGSESSLALSWEVTSKAGHVVVVGLGGGKLHVPGVDVGVNERRLSGVMWGSPKELSEVLALYKAGKVAVPVERRGLDQVNDALADLVAGTVDGRLVLTH